jgi:hypothetical protein
VLVQEELFADWPLAQERQLGVKDGADQKQAVSTESAETEAG